MARKSVKFEDKLAVIRVKKAYAAPFLKYKYVYLTRRDINDRDRFKQKIDEIATSWPPSVYMLKHPSGKIFARFRVSDGKMTLLYKTSPATGSLYPVWEFFKELA
ncbi:MAG: hypothetical protein VW380_01770 [Candidatus Woesearchaeota archaeon]|jgi:hypothetical protein